MAEPNFPTSALYVADNLTVMRDMDGETVDLIATDPPFNKSVVAFRAKDGTAADGQSFTDKVRLSAPRTDIVLHEGDCRGILPTMDAESVHLVVTDPPYFLDGLDDGWRKGKGGRRGTGTVAGLPVGMNFDPRQGHRLQEFIGEVGAELLRVLVPGGFAVVFSQPRLAHRMAVGLEDAGFEIRDLLAWHFTKRSQFKAQSMDHFIDMMKRNRRQKQQLKRFMKGYKTPQLRPQFEAMVLAQKPKAGKFAENYEEFAAGLIDSKATLDGKTPATVMHVEKQDKETGNDHLTVKPVLLIEHLIRLLSRPGQMVLDPFLGSGTTAVAALRTDRGCIGIEINPAYVEMAKGRLGIEQQ